jgi:hypothetical protein
MEAVPVATSAKRVALADQSQTDILTTFYAAPDEAWFSQVVVAAVLGCSEAKLERDRWLGVGLPYSRFGRGIRYQKRDVTTTMDSGRRHTSGAAA